MIYRLDNRRIIGQYRGENTAAFSPLVIVLGAIHGNEPAGIAAIERLLAALETLKKGQFRGTIIGLCGNVAALARGVRYLEQDLNRLFAPTQIARARALAPERRHAEDRELLELLNTIAQEIRQAQPSELILIDLHTTSAQDGIFAIAPEADAASEQLAQQLAVPVVRKLTQGIGGTVLHYFNTSNMGIPTRVIGFEAGQHADPQSAARALAVLLTALETLDCLDSDVLPSLATVRNILARTTQHLPHLVELIYTHQLNASDAFEMLPDFRNFQPVQKGQHLANDIRGKICSPDNGLILMPLYQKKGNDGFFLVHQVD